jgi:8-oxo-dGTP diphosphatase
MAGGWEFPGGKVGADEVPFAALVRELREELAVRIASATRLIAYEHRYLDRAVLLDLWLVGRFEGTPISAEGQAIKWVRVDELETVGLLDADRPMIPVLRRALGAE